MPHIYVALASHSSSFIFNKGSQTLSLAVSSTPILVLFSFLFSVTKGRKKKDKEMASSKLGVSEEAGVPFLEDHSAVGYEKDHHGVLAWRVWTGQRSFGHSKSFNH